MPLSNEEIRYAGRAILQYRPLPTANRFHASPAKNRWYFGGNRSGKSEANIGFDLCSFALGLHPHRKTPPNATIWACANAWPLVGKLLWSEKIKNYLPATQIKKIVWHNRAEEIPKEIHLKSGVCLELKAYEQSRKAFEGRAVDAIYTDEQCKSDSEGIWQEMQARLLDKNGFSAHSMTPIMFQLWLEQRIKQLPDSDEIFYANLNDNRKSAGGYIDDKEIALMIDQWPDEVKETRIKGYFAAFAGAVYKIFSRDTHVIKPFEIPEDWSRYRSVDWGFNNPCVCLWLARDPDNRWYVYNEHYQSRETLAYHAEKIKQKSRTEKYRVTWADHDSQDRHEFAQLGIPTMPAQKDIHLGIEAVQKILKVQPDGKPRLFIFKNCVNTIREIIGYKWAEGTDSKDPTDEPLKVNDHTCDSLRYAVYAIEGSFYFSDSDLS